MKYIFDAIMFTAGLALCITLFHNAAYGVAAGAILAGATEAIMGAQKEEH